ncbi:MAG: DUF4154 domain-containing protein [Nitrospinaceae bacterium]|nr:YfiR family protein [Nitrospinaceae bacterium]NIR54887.1 YfiR family protein [Nitrospinaceae bacterium]NIS85313.1 YfiR family protein [Nitrospinaceae bacterium]NIT82125.1 YfiR family protein [Nitrospinaceae bacterium]NIU44383.1 YfiR family protein [Nitrospinaceae bacterium]
MNRKRIYIWLMIWCMGAGCVLMPGRSYAVSETYAATVEYQVKAAFIHNFAKFVNWPEDTFENDSSPIRVGIVGRGKIDEALIALDGKKINNRHFSVSRVRHLKFASGYHMIFINPARKSTTRAILNRLKGLGILTIGDQKGFAEQGGAINFYLQEGKVRFEINIDAARREHLKVSSKLLRLARIVSSENP